MVREEIKRIIKKFANELKKNGIKIDKIILFGSYARGDYKEWSDIDVAVVSESFGTNRFEERLFLSRIAAKIDSRIEAHPVGKKEFEKDDWKLLISEIKKEGIEIAA